MSLSQWATVISLCVALVASLCTIYYSRQATRNWKQAEKKWREAAANWERAADNYRNAAERRRRMQ